VYFSLECIDFVPNLALDLDPGKEGARSDAGAGQGIVEGR
jgi:hypothetical protein